MKTQKWILNSSGCLQLITSEDKCNKITRQDGTLCPNRMYSWPTGNQTNKCSREAVKWTLNLQLGFRDYCSSLAEVVAHLCTCGFLFPLVSVSFVMSASLTFYSFLHMLRLILYDYYSCK